MMVVCYVVYSGFGCGEQWARVKWQRSQTLNRWALMITNMVFSMASTLLRSQNPAHHSLQLAFGIIDPACTAPGHEMVGSDQHHPVLVHSAHLLPFPVAVHVISCEPDAVCSDSQPHGQADHLGRQEPRVPADARQEREPSVASKIQRRHARALSIPGQPDMRQVVARVCGDHHLAERIQPREVWWFVPGLGDHGGGVQIAGSFGCPALVPRYLSPLGPGSTALISLDPPRCPRKAGQVPAPARTGPAQ